MIYVKTEDLKIGMRLARPIYNKRGVLLYGRDDRLTKQGIESVNNFGLIGLYILEPAEPVPPMTDEEIEAIGAGDQGIMFGFACNETPEMMPLPISLAHKLSYRLAQVRKQGIVDYLRPDGKMQVTVEYKDGVPYRVDTIVISLQHNDNIDKYLLEEDIKREIIDKVIDKKLLVGTKYLINPTGRFVIGGPVGDTGLTGRKIVVDTYGGYSIHGGGAFSGKDYTKVDRSAAYYARYVCKNLVASGICNECMIGVSYAIGVSRPVSIDINTFGTSKISNDKISLEAF